MSSGATTSAMSAPDRRQRFVEVTFQAVRSEGPGVSMERIGELAGASKPAIYRVFGSKLGLYRAVADQFITDLLLDVATLIEVQPALDKFIPLALDRILSRVEDDAALYQFLMRRARLELSSTGAVNRPDFLRQFGDAIAEIIADRLRLVGEDPDPAPIWAHAVVGMVNAVLDWWIDHPEIERAVVVERLTAIMWFGFEPVAVPVVGRKNTSATPAS